MPPGVYKHKPHSEKTKKKMSIIRRGQKQTKEWIEKRSKANTGKKRSLEQIERIRLSQLGKIVSDETKKKLSLKSKGRKHNEKTKAILREIRMGEKSSWWKGGISQQKYPLDWTTTLKNSIRERDDYTCQECGIHQDELDGKFKNHDVHHINYIKENLNPNNLITLCKSCHSKTNINREYWQKYFNYGKQANNFTRLA